MLSVAVYSNYSGHIHETINTEGMPGDAASANTMTMAPAATTQELTLKEGMYVQKGQSVFTVYNPSRLWALLSIYGDNAAQVKVGTPVRITPESAPAHNFRATIDYIEPFFQPESKTLTARVYFSNKGLNIPVGSQVRAVIFAKAVAAQWLPKEAILSLGSDKVVFRKESGSFRAHKVETGMQQDNLVQVTAGLALIDSVASNAQYLVDNEAFIKATQQ
jgi:membrane fusion protein, copper/silver efflux system